MNRWSAGGAGPGARALTTLLLISLGACDDPAGPDDRAFHLSAVEGAASMLLGDGVEASDGTLSLEGRALTQRLTLRCRAEAPGCTLPEGWAMMTGVVGSEPVTPAGARRVTWSDTREALLTVEADTAWVSHPLPAHAGLGSVVLRFER